MIRYLKNILTWIQRHIFLSTIILIVLLIGIYMGVNRITTPPLELTVQHPVRKDIAKTLAISGIVDAKEKARLRFLNGGKVVYVGATEGEEVTRGQTIATIDQRTLQKQLEQDLNTFMQERLRWDQTNVDIFSNEYTQSEERTRQQAELDLVNRVLNVEMRSIGIENTRLHAPFNGILTVSPTIVAGVQLTAADYFEVVNPESLIFRAAVDEIDLAGLKTDLPAILELDSYQNKKFDTYVNYISYTATDTQTRTVFIVEFPIDTTAYAQDLFRIGMNGEAIITLETRKNALTIPLRATRERNGITLVDIEVPEKPGVIQEREISIGLETENEVEVISGLDENDRVVIP